VTWNVTQVRLGVAFGWQFDQPIDTTPVLQQIQPPPSPPPVIAFTPPSVSVQIVGVDGNGTERPGQAVRVEQTKVTTLHPMLGHVYFEAGESALPERYRRGIARAQQDTMRLQPREAVHAELYVIAQRIMSTPGAKITVTGTTAGNANDQGLVLARARAETVRDILVSLGVSVDRIDLQVRAVPQKMTTASDTSESKLAIDENRRAEITSAYPGILAPLTLGSTDVSVTPSTYRVLSSVTSAVPITSAVVEVRQGSRVLARSERVKVPVDTLLVDLREADIAAFTDEPMIASIAATDSVGQSADARVSLPVEVSSVSKGRVENLGATQIERYQLILFDFNDVTVTGANARLLTLIRSRITPSTQVRIIGATDVMGSREYNAELSLRRAREVARLLQVSAPTIVGSGEVDARFDNALPEGRAYNRTVIIELINTVK
jgi:outer membrane protein OmpA-like peptidoglycan-associated protein